jgi:hypothetical protein
VTRWIVVVWRSGNGFMTKRTLKHHPWRVQSLLGEAQHVGEVLNKDTSVARIGYVQHRTRPEYLGCYAPPIIAEMSTETVWKSKTAPILESHERADRDQQALYRLLMLPETTFNEPSSYFPDSLTRGLLGNC